MKWPPGMLFAAAAAAAAHQHAADVRLAVCVHTYLLQQTWPFPSSVRPYVIYFLNHDC